MIFQPGRRRRNRLRIHAFNRIALVSWQSYNVGFAVVFISVTIGLDPEHSLLGPSKFAENRKGRDFREICSSAGGGPCG